MNNMEIFKSEEFGEIRTAIINNEPWFVAKDVAVILGYSDTEKMTRRLDDDEKLTSHFGASGQNREMIIISESGLYNAIIGSKKPEAKAFKKWVTSEVLPSIRKNGIYATRDFVRKAIQSPEYAIAILTELQNEREEKEILSQQLRVVQPKVDMYDTAMESRDGILMGEVAKLTKKFGRNKLFEFLREKGIFMKNSTLPYQSYVDAGWFTVHETPYRTPGGSVRINTFACATQRGLDNILRIIRKAEQGE